jgi:hypothetical protein
MAVQTATNPDTGERVALVDGEWKPVVKTATNPDTGARAFLVGDQWLVNEATAKPAPKVTPKEEPVVSHETVTEERPDLGSPMGESFISEVANAGAPKRQSVLEGQKLPPVAPTEDQYVVDPKFVRAVQAQLDAMPEEQRTEALAKMVQRPDVYGRAARAVQGRYEALNKVESPTLRNATDLRLEVQKARLMAQGRSEQGAEGDARNAALMGQARPDYQQMTRDIVGEQAGEAAKEQAEELKNAGFFERAGAEAYSKAAQTGLGIMQVYADMTGNKQMSNDLMGAQRVENARGAAVPEGESLFAKSAQHAVASLASQAPAMILSAITGSAAPALAFAGIQQFGQAYGEGRQQGLSPELAGVRAGELASAEIIFERFGMTKAFSGLKSYIKNNPKASISEYFGKALLKEPLPEFATTLTQYGIDIQPGVGLNKNPSWNDLFEQLAETFRQTIIQAGATAIGGIAVTKGAQGAVKLLATNGEEARAPYKQDQSYQGLAEAMMQNRGFLTPEGQRAPADQTVPIVPNLNKVAETPAAEKTAATEVPTVDKEAKIKKLAEDYMNSGYQEDDALAQAKDEVNAELGITPEAAGPIESNKLKAWPQAMLEGTLDLQLKKPAEKRDKGLMAQIEAELIRRQGEQNVTRPITTPTGVSTGAPSEPTTTVPAGGVGGAQPNGVVPATENAGLPPSREATQPAPIEEAPAPAAVEEAPPTPSKPTAEKAYAERVKNDPTAPPFSDTDARIERVAAQYEQMGDKDFAKIVRDISKQGRPSYEETAQLEAALEAEQNQHQKDKDFAEKKAKVESIARVNASSAFDQVDNYPNLQEAIDSLRNNMGDTLVEEGYKKGDDWDVLLRAANRAFEEEVNKRKGTELGTETTETEQATQEGQAQPTTAKRGPKGARLTEDEKIERAKGKKVSDADNAQAERDHKKYGALLEKSPSKTEREHSITALLKAWKSTIGRPVSKRIKTTLEANATAQEIEQAKTRIALEEGKNASATAEGVESTAPANNRFNYADNAAQALDIVAKTGNPFQRFLAKRLKRYVSGVTFTVVSEGMPLPPVLQQYARNWSSSRAMYIREPDTGKRHIFVRGAGVGHGINNIDVLHEALHAATNQKIYLGNYALSIGAELDSDLVQLFKALNELMEKARAEYIKQKRAGKLDAGVINRVESTKDEKGDYGIFNTPHEFLAYGMSDDNIQDFLMGIEGTRTDETLFSKFVRSIMRLFSIGDGYYNAFSDLVDITDRTLSANKTTKQRAVEKRQMESVVAQHERIKNANVAATTTQQDLDKIAEDNALVKKNLEALAVSTDPEVVGKATSALQVLRNPSKLLGATARAVNGLGYGAKSFLLNIPTTDAVSALSGIDSLKRANIELERMAGMGKQMLDSAGKIIDSIEKRFDEANDPTLRKKVDLFTYATQGINPVTNKNVPQINTMWNSLGPAGQTIFKDVVKYYDHMYKYTGTLLKQIVAEASQGTSQGPAILKQLNDLLAADNRIESYVPLLRDQGGKFFIRVKDSGAFFIRDSVAKREALIANIAKKTGKTRKQLIADGDITVGNNVADLRKTAISSSTLLKEIVTMVETSPNSPQMGIDDISRQDVTDSIIQLWLQLQPEQSMRKGFIHRKTTPGYDVDIVQGLVRSAVKFSIQIPKLKYGRMIRNSISSAKSSIAQTPEMTPYVTEMERRADSVLNPPLPSDNPIQQKVVATLRFANSMAYTYYLSQATALANTISAYELGVPQLLKKHSVAEVTAKMSKLMVIWNSLSKKDANGNLIMPTIAGSSVVTDNASDNAEQKQRKAEGRRAINAMKSLNVSESTAARAMYGKIEIPSANYGSKVEKAKYIAKQVATLGVGEIIHATERISREFIYFASFELNRDKALAKFRKTLAYQAATDKVAAEAKYIDENFDALTLAAKKDVDQSLFNYSTANRPAWLKSDVGQFLFQFMMWRLSAAQFIARNFIGMIKPMDGDTRAECMRAFFAVLGTSWSVAGTVGMPLLGTVFAFMSALYDRERDKLPADMRQLDPKTWYKTTWLKEQLGDITIGNKSLDTIIRQGPLNALTGVDVGSHVSMSDLFFNTEFKEGSNKGVRTEIANYVMSLAPPSITMGANMIEGISMITHGDTRKGFEKIVPSAAWRNLFTAQRYATEGETGRNNEKILNARAMRISEIVGQAVGLRPVMIKDIKDATQAEFKLSQKVEGKQKELLDDMFRAYSKQDVPEYKRLYQETYEFNKKYSATYPEYEIDEDLINNSFDAKEEALSESWRGARVTEKNAVPAYRLLSPSRKAAAEREAQSR